MPLTNALQTYNSSLHSYFIYIDNRPMELRVSKSTTLVPPYNRRCLRHTHFFHHEHIWEKILLLIPYTTIPPRKHIHRDVHLTHFPYQNFSVVRPFSTTAISPPQLFTIHTFGYRRKWVPSSRLTYHFLTWETHIPFSLLSTAKPASVTYPK